MPKAKLPKIKFKWTPDLAYIVGLLTTDGNLSPDSRHVTMLSSDTQLLRTFCSCLDLPKKSIKERSPTGFGKNPNYNYRPSYRVQFSRVQLYHWLTTIGLFPNKTYTLGKIKVPDKYFRDFLRGWFDGDGSIFTYTDYYNTKKNPKYVYQRLYVKFTSVSIKHLSWLLKTIRRLTKLKGTLIVKKPQKGRKNRISIGEIKFSKKEAIKLLSWIYYRPRLPCLERKYNIAKLFLKNKNKGKTIP
jgi:hypothetical protein